ncbi:hypothetical protein WJX72_011891 [[Myrmecia] bisecta]|uniref:Uncharacterized protein n=1 Tax=[Myrmecia] bisecta TaxID=41462 RepID=A0AAW1Q5S4_9CHLO
MLKERTQKLEAANSQLRALKKQATDAAAAADAANKREWNATTALRSTKSTSKLEQLQSALAELDQEAARYKDELKLANGDAKVLQGQLREKGAQVAALEEQVAAQRAVLADAQGALSAAQQQAVAYAARIEQLQAGQSGRAAASSPCRQAVQEGMASGLSMEETEAVLEEMRQLQQKLDGRPERPASPAGLSQQEAEALRALVARLEGRVRARDLKIQDLQCKADDGNASSLQAAQARLAKLQSDIAHKTAEVHRLHADGKHLQGQLDAKQKLLLASEAEIRKLQQQLASAHKQATEGRAELRRLRRSASQDGGGVAASTTGSQQQQSERVANTQPRSAAPAGLGMLEEGASVAMRLLQERAEAAESKARGFEAKLAAAQAQAADLESSLASVRQQLQQVAEQSITHADGLEASLALARQQLQDVAEQSSTHVSKLRSQVQRHERERISMDAEMQASQEKISILKSRFKYLEAELAEARVMALEAHAARSYSSRPDRKELALRNASTAVAARLREEAARKEAQLEELRRELALRDAQSRQLQGGGDELENIKQRMAEVSERMRRREQQVEVLEVDLKAARRVWLAKDSYIVALKAELNDAKQQLLLQQQQSRPSLHSTSEPSRSSIHSDPS